MEKRGQVEHGDVEVNLLAGGIAGDVKQVVAKVQLGEADAGIVYRTDLTASVAPKLTTITVPAGFNVVAAYPLSVVKGAPNERTARAFVAFVLSDEGQAILRKYGFETGGHS